MAALKTDYKDAVYTGNRKYTQTNNADGTISLVDATAYSTEGDTFGAADINATNTAVNENSDLIGMGIYSVNDLYQKIRTITMSLTLTAASWSNGSYTIYDALITATSNQEIIPAPSISADQYKALVKASLVATGQTAGSITIKAFGATPTIDIPVTIIFRGEK